MYIAHTTSSEVITMILSNNIKYEVEGDRIC